MEGTAQGQSESDWNKAVVRRFVEEVQNKKTWISSTSSTLQTLST